MATTRRKTVSVSNADINWIKDQLLEQHTVLMKLNQTIIGDKEYGQKGLVEQVNDHRRYILKTKISKLNLWAVQL